MNAANLSGETVRRDKMNAQTATVSVAGFRFMPIVFAALIGLGIVTLSGHVQASALHDAAHDVRHATGFPCH